MNWNEDDSGALEAVLEKLDGVRKQGGYWMARCPSHEDAKASLSIARGTQQPVVFKCHAGCHRDDILLALGMTLQEVSAPPGERAETEWTPRGPATAVYHYRDEKGVLLFDVLRTATKDFPLRVPDPLAKSGWRWKLGETRRVLYRLPELLAAIEEGKPVWITEGEKDADRLYREGVVATCNPGGAGKWQPEYAETFAGCNVTIVADCDTTGRAHARAIARALTGVAATVEIREAATGKDVSNHLDAGKTLNELETTRESEKQDSTMGISLVRFLSTPDDPQAWVIRDILERGDRLILTGGEGLGKSTLTRQLAVGASAGIHPFTLHFGERMKVLFIDCENKDRKSKRRFRPLAETVAGMQRPLSEEGFRIHHIPAGIDLTKDDWSGFLIEQVTAYRPDLLVCGPLYKLHAVDISEETAARTIVNVLEDAMSVSDCALITEAHMAKGSSSETRDLSPAGSRLFLGWPDAGYGLRASKPGDRRRVKVIPWRGDREERKWPRELMWNTNYVGMPWVEPMDEANPSWGR